MLNEPYADRDQAIFIYNAARNEIMLRKRYACVIQLCFPFLIGLFITAGFLPRATFPAHISS